MKGIELFRKRFLATSALTVLFAALVALPAAGRTQPPPGLEVSAERMPALSVRLTSPNGGEIWKAGEKREITWVVSEGADITSVAIFYSSDSGSKTEFVASLQGNSASYTWNVPLLTSANALVSIEVADSKGNRARDQSDANFTIMNPDPRPDLVASIESSEKVAFIKSVSITVTVKNTGTALSPESLCEITVRNAHAPRQILRKFEKKIRELAGGDSFSFSSSLKLGIGLFEICAVVDSKSKIPERDEANNRACITVAGK